MKAPQHIVLATDFSSHADAAAEFAATLAVAFRARLSVLHSVPVPYPYPVPPPPEYFQERRQLLEKFCAKLRLRVPDVAAVFREGEPWSEIVSFAESSGADMVVMGTHGRRGIKRALLGSVAEKVVRLSKIPVITVPLPPETAASPELIRNVPNRADEGVVFGD